MIDCEPTKQDIKCALMTLYSSSFQEKLINVDNPYGNGGVAQRVVTVLRKSALNGLLKKSFYNINQTQKK